MGTRSKSRDDTSSVGSRITPYILRNPFSTPETETLILTQYADSLELPDTNSYEFDIVGTSSAVPRKRRPRPAMSTKPMPRPGTRSRGVRFQEPTLSPSQEPGRRASAWPAGSSLRVEQGQLRRGSVAVFSGQNTGETSPLRSRERSPSSLSSRRMSVASGRLLAALRFGRGAGPVIVSVGDVSWSDLEADHPRDLHALALLRKLAPLVWARTRRTSHLVRDALVHKSAEPVLENAVWYYYALKVLPRSSPTEGEGPTARFKKLLADAFSLYNFNVIGKLPREPCSFLQAKFHLILAFAVTCAMRQLFEGSLGRFDTKFEVDVVTEFDSIFCGFKHDTRLSEAALRALFPSAFDRSGGPVRIRGATASSPTPDSEQPHNHMDLLVDTLVAKDPTQIPGGAPTALVLHSRWLAVLRMTQNGNARAPVADPLRGLGLLPVPAVARATTYARSQSTQGTRTHARRRVKSTRQCHYAVAPLLKDYVPDRGLGFHSDLQLHQPAARTLEEEIAATSELRERQVGAHEQYTREREAVRQNWVGQAERFQEYRGRERTRFLQRWSRVEASMQERLKETLGKRMAEMERHVTHAMLKRNDEDSPSLDATQLTFAALEAEMYGSALLASDAADALREEEQEIHEVLNGVVTLGLPGVDEDSANETAVRAILADEAVQRRLLDAHVSPPPLRVEGPLFGGGWGHCAVTRSPSPEPQRRLTTSTPPPEPQERLTASPPLVSSPEEDEGAPAVDVAGLTPDGFIRACTPKKERKRRVSAGLVASSSPQLLAVWDQRSSPAAPLQPSRASTPRPTK